MFNKIQNKPHITKFKLLNELINGDMKTHHTYTHIIISIQYGSNIELVPEVIDFFHLTARNITFVK